MAADNIVPFRIGSFECVALRDGDDWDRNILLIKTGDHHILIDTGLGREREPIPALLLERLALAGTSADEIDVVILTHADWDHTQGAVDANGQPAFPNARYVLTRDERAFWSSNPERHLPDDRYDEDFRRFARTFPQTRLAQLRDHLELVAGGAEIVPGIRMLAAPGHTPGHAVVAVSSEAEQLLCIADLTVADPKDIENPNWFNIYDFDRAHGSATRARIFQQAANEGTLLMAYHFPFPGLGHVTPQGEAWRWQPLETAV